MINIFCKLNIKDKYIFICNNIYMQPRYLKNTVNLNNNRYSKFTLTLYFKKQNKKK